MRDANVLFVSDDLALRDSIYESVPKVKGCRLYLLNHEDLQPSLTYSSVDLLIYHIQSSSNSSRIEALFNSSDFSPKSISTLIVSDDHLPERSLKFLKMGVVDCLSRPLDLRRLAYLIDSLTLRARNEATIQSPGVSLCNSSASAEEDFYYSSPKLKQVLDYVRKAARQDTTLLLTGETGTGKTFLARLIHQLSPRSSEPYIDVNCGTLQESLIESELFGHRKGAFTGADSDRDGRFSLPRVVHCFWMKSIRYRSRFSASCFARLTNDCLNLLVQTTL